ncbi:MAG: phosphotriesterase-related protein [Chloroflexi bacterium]|nr:phosphotriesterase-related protein [Chloroflexota bacterium]MDP6498507.1 phosphotriesterase-related protein [Dehalococcoidia bacterium]MQG10892.1 phosphotriesterase-related protein [SAR202 cluster bacterium]MQG54000.1 phosphotriesterase-related protein [SAR202 cluster bacterium]|tara:strand:- start:102517 stop:103470 length:954 start_codon:yes stop_codon:yes gene_type:complete
MPTINTVLGPVDTSELGFTLSHEHLATNAAGILKTFPELVDRAGVIEQANATLREASLEGLRTIIDVTTIDLGRDVEMMREVSQTTGVHIVAATGNHLAVPRPFVDLAPEVIAGLYVREIEVGIEGTGIKAGIIKVASDEGGVTRPQEVVLRAAGQACVRTGTPISTHTWSPDRVGEQQVRILQDEGVDMDKVYIGHSNDDMDMSYLLGLLRKGVWLGLDRFPGGRRPGTPYWEERTQLAKQLIDAGYTDRIMLSHDHSVPKARYGVAVQEERIKYNPDGYNFITRNVLPRLKDMGVSDDMINQIMVENPRRFLAGK